MKMVFVDPKPDPDPLRQELKRIIIVSKDEKEMVDLLEALVRRECEGARCAAVMEMFEMNGESYECDSDLNEESITLLIPIPEENDEAPKKGSENATASKGDTPEH